MNPERGRSILLTNYHLRSLAGSELVTLDLGRLFRSRGWDVAVAAWDVGQPMQGLFIDNGMSVVGLDDPALWREFDLLWAHHWPTIATVLASGCTSARKVVFSSLGPSEPLETPPLGGGVDLYVTNSQETSALMATLGIGSESVFLLPNSLLPEWIEAGTARHGHGNLQSVAFVSNHLPDEEKEAMAIIGRRGILTIHVGSGGVSEYVTPALISRFDAVVSIGRTVVQGLAAGVPAFCYDLFGGSGWVTPGNVEAMAQVNFSGRDSPSRLSADEIAERLISGWDGAAANSHELHAWVKATRSLDKNVNRVLTLLDSRPDRDMSRFSTDWAVVSRYASCLFRADDQHAQLVRQCLSLSDEITAMRATRGWRVLEALRHWNRSLRIRSEGRL